MKLIKGFYWFILLLFVVIQIRVNAQAQELPNKSWHFLTDVYLLLPNMDGEMGIGENLTVPIDANPGDIFDKLKMGGMLYLEAQTDKWAITTDLVFMNLNQEITPGKIITSGDVTGKQYIWEAAGLYRLLPYLELGIGGRLNNLQTSIDVTRKTLPSGTNTFSGSRSATWYDPVLITRLSTDINNKWIFQFRGDLGGFGIGSDFTWQLQAVAGYRFTKVFQVTAGYRYFSIDYKKDTENSQFIFDVDEFGPQIRLGFNF